MKTWRKLDFCYKVSENLSQLSPAVTWKVEVTNNAIRHLADGIPSKGLRVAPDLLPLIVKCEESGLKEELLEKKKL